MSFKNTLKAAVCRPAVYNKGNPIETTYCKFYVSFKEPLRNLVSLFLVALQIVDRKPATLVKRGLLEIFRKASFRKKPMHVLKFSTVLQNAEISLVTSLKIDSTTTFHHSEVILPAILKTLGILTGKICSGVSLQYSYRWVDWTAQTSRLHACIFREKRGAFAKNFFEIFEILECCFLSENFKNIICSGVFSAVADCGQYSCNCNKRKFQYIRFSGFFPKYSVQLF